MDIRLIKSESDYQAVLNRVEELFHAPPGTPENEELEILLLLIEKYETEIEEAFPNPAPIEIIKFRMEQMGLEQKDLSRILGSKSRASMLLAQKRPMSLDMIRKLSKELMIPADILIQPYETVQ